MTHALPAFEHPLHSSATEREWWRGATIYQIYPRSFVDSNGDGVGDLRGITSRLDYVASLGVDAIWISPFFTSPMKDFGYDVADYCDIDPLFGTLEDFDVLIARAHELGLRVTIDQVYSHTSDVHVWFAESRCSQSNPKADWYVWADAKPDGTPPTNWQSVFGGPAWTWDARRRQYYLHNFLSSQPQLNCHNLDVQDALLNVARFWLDRGVDGFRLDALNFAMHDPELKDNPPASLSNKPRTRSFDFQRQVNNQSHADIPSFIERIRRVTDEYDCRFTVAEVGGEGAEREMKLFTAGEARLNSAYGFNFLYADQLTPKLVREALEEWPDTPDTGWPSWAFENHDAPRAISRWVSPEHARAFAELKILLLVSLRGNVILYQGEELGLTQVDIPFDQLQDPEAIANWPLTLSRDGARTPLPWEANAPQFGFTTATPWLPFGADHGPLAVDQQEADPQSLLYLTRRMLAFRKANEALVHGTFAVLEADQSLLAFERATEWQTLLIVCNLAQGAISWQPDQPEAWQLIETVNGAKAGDLPGYSAAVFERIVWREA
jgi:alpha-glucosidase